MNGKKIVVIDYQMSNLYSVKNACRYNGIDVMITSDKNEVISADAVILPGVGAFSDAVSNLKKLDLICPIKDFVDSGKPFMGICLGMQLLFSESEEFGRSEGLALIPGKVVRFDVSGNIKVPHVGWSPINSPKSSARKWEDSPLKDVQENEYMYFVHSFYAVPENNKDILSVTSYGNNEFCSSVLRGNVFATQFHPEKSANEGLKIYSKWLREVSELEGEKN
jgi:glutamine amidotransferase